MRFSHSLAALRAVKADWSARLLGRSTALGSAAAVRVSRVLAPPSARPERNVVGIGIGEKVVAGRPTGVLAVTFLVRTKFPADQIVAAERLPRTVDGVPTDVEEVGVFRKFPLAPRERPRRPSPVSWSMPNPRARSRPARPGCSVGFQEPGTGAAMTGTLGAVVRRGAATFILSNNHVLADENRLAAGTPIVQPGLLDGGRSAPDRLATLAGFVPLRTGASNDIDGAIARVARARDVAGDVLHIGAVRGTVPATLDMVVHKFGRTSGYTVGRVTSVDTDVVVAYDTGDYTFGGQIIVRGLGAQPFSDAGDSGALIVERPSNRAVGLLFAGSRACTIANPIDSVLAALDVVLA